MNKGQRSLLVIWSFLLGLVLLFPPWKLDSQTLPPVRHLITNPPTLQIMENEGVLDRFLEDLPRTEVPYEIDWFRLLLISGILSAGTGVFLLVLRDK
jgi:hypothetical protein